MCQENKTHRKAKRRKISLNPLEFDEAVEDLLQIPPKPQKGSSNKQKQERKSKENDTT